MKLFLASFLILLCAISVQRCAKPENSQVSDDSRPDATIDSTFDYNIVLIVIDTLRADHLPFYGYSINTASFLNELSAKSVVFENAYAASSWTAPSTASIFTSLYPIQHGVVTGMRAYEIAKKDNQSITLNKIPDKLSTMAEVLKSAGFKTYAVADNLNISKEEGFDQGFDKFKTFEYVAAHGVNEHVLKWEKDIKRGGKYFLYLHYMDPHQPYHYREPWFKRLADPRMNLTISYDSEINYVDGRIQELFNRFGWSKNTLVIVTSDHGEELFDHGNKGHTRTLYDELVRVPFMIYFPDGGIEAARINSNVSNIDILPTMREMIGLPPDTSIEGLSLVPLLKNQALAERHFFPQVQVNEKIFGEEINLKAVVRGNWKYILSFSGSQELYNLENDPREKLNEIDNAPEIAGSLRDQLINFETNCTKYGQESVTITLDEKTLDHLKSLGYLQ